MATQPNLALARRLNMAAVVISVIVLLLVGLMRRIKLDVGVDLHFLPMVNAILNTGTTLSLVGALYFVKNGNIASHQKMINLALTFSVTFLLCYVAYHFTTPETKYLGIGILRYIYYFLLITHVILAATVFPFILFTYIRGFTTQVESHRRMARIVFPLWLYVSVTGVVCYLLLSPYYS